MAVCLLVPVLRAGSVISKPGLVNGMTTIASSSASLAARAKAEAIEIFNKLDLDQRGLSESALVYAYEGLKKLESQGKVEKGSILTVCDFSKPSTSKRMYIIDTENEQLLLQTYVAHGKNSGLNYAERFSNRPESLQSSLGFYVTKNTYFGKHGLSLRLDGMERGFNDKAYQRAVVVHGANYIGDSRRNASYMGRSFGCPAVPAELSRKVINLIKDGTCLFIYHPTASYLHGSKLLNG